MIMKYVSAARHNMLQVIDHIVLYLKARKRSIAQAIVVMPMITTIVLIIVTTKLVMERNAHKQMFLQNQESLHNWLNSSISADTERLAKTALNKTLGFGEIVYISMPHRTDRQDAMVLMSSLYDLKFTKIDGVNGSTIAEKAIPENKVRGRMRDSELGCWRAHVNAWVRLLESDMDTMLILEDDVDFDINIHKIFARISSQMQRNKMRIKPPTEYEKQNAPYGLDWDIMHVGQCSDYANKKRIDLVQEFDDPDAPTRKQTKDSYASMMEVLGVKSSDFGKKRIISPSWGPVCTMGYAITRQGAQRMLLNFSYISLIAPIDIDIILKIQEGKLRGYTITPNVFSAWRVDGSKDSDNITPEGGFQDEGKSNTEGWSENIRNSARRHMVDALQLSNWEDYERLLPPKNSKSQ
ncbi:hypothetical protein V1511DRAFT_499198 [Dipodascopsis uninucleata]